MNQDTYSFILRSKMFKISLKQMQILNINDDIYHKLFATKQYEVKSNVNDYIFQSFIDYLVSKKTPNINLENISQYDLLSDEFDCMQNIIQLFRKLTSNVELLIHLKEKEDLEQQLLKKNKQIQTEKSNYTQILKILFKNKGISDHSEFLKIKDKLLENARRGYIDQFDLLMKKKMTENELIFSLNEEEKTAGLYRCLSKSESVFVPYSVTFQSEEFIVTKIHSNSFEKSKTIKTVIFPENSELSVIEKKSFISSSIENITFPSSVHLIDEMSFYKCDKLKSIEFSKNSKLNTIEKNAFDSSFIESLSIPSSVSDLKSGWCIGSKNLNHIEIIPTEGQNNLLNFDDKFILRKSDTKSDIFDVIVFARPDIEKVEIPSFIKIIDQYAFCNCNQLKTVEFQKNSKLEIIESCSFSGSSIENITIPSSVTRIGDSCFASCHNFKSIQFSEDSKLYSIGKFAFFMSSLERIVVPPLVRQIEESTFLMCSSLQKVEFSENSNLKSIENYAFNSSSIKSLTIPSSLIDFKGMCFIQTMSLTDIKIIPKSQKNITYYDDKFLLKKSDPLSDDFDVLLLARRDIEYVKIPPFIKQIAQQAFYHCTKIKSIELSPNLKLIGMYSFSLSSIENIKIPSSVIKIEKNAFSDCNKLKNIEFSQEAKLNVFDEFSFCRSSIESIKIPSEIVTIKQFSFGQCRKLKNVEFLNDSKIETIGNEAFSHSSIESLTIPSSIVDLKRYWCAYTPKLNEIKIIEIKNKENIKHYGNKIIIGKSNLNSQIFDVLLFANRNIEKIKIPSFIRKINSYAFNYCVNLKTIKFSSDSKLEIFDKYSFSGCLFEALSFPQNVKMIEYASFSECKKLQIIELFDNSEACMINTTAFGLTMSNIMIMIPVKKKITFFNTW